MDKSSTNCDNGYGIALTLIQSESMYRKWLSQCFEETGKTQAGLAKRLGVNPSAVTRMLKGGRKIGADELPVMAAYFGRALPQEQGGRLPEEGATLQNASVVEVLMRGTVEAGEFQPADDIYAQDETPVVTHTTVSKNFPNARYNGWTVKGDSMDRIGIMPGDQIVTVDVLDSGWTPKDGQLVVVERVLDGAYIERSVKRVNVGPDWIGFEPVSHNKRHKSFRVARRPTDLPGMEIRVIGVVIKIVRDPKII
jgi:SOS-response transcriptional repressor LexA